MSQPPSHEPPHGARQPRQVQQPLAGPPQTPSPGEPARGYPQQYPGAPAPASSGPITGKTGILATAVAVVMLVGTGAWYVVSDSGGDPKQPVAGLSDDTGGGRQTGDGLNTGRKPGEAKVAWLQKNEADLTRAGDEISGPWFVGDTVITALYRSVSGYAVADGKEKWSVDLPADICATPNSTTSDGKIVIGVKSSNSDRADCSVLQMVDLNTGKAGWKTTIKKDGIGDMLSDVGLAISGNTVTAGRTSNFNAYQVSDGKELFGTPKGSCKTFALAGGPKLIAAANCGTDDVKNPQHQVLELDRVSGKAKMTYQPPRGWEVEKVYSVDPLVVRLGLGDKSKKQHAIASISESGKLLFSQMIPPKDEILVASCGNTFDVFDTRLEGCSGVVADANTFYMATKSKGEYGSAPHKQGHCF
ncbi:PQQ-binding-like beta-propeller repeat protein [Streptomyces cyaneofuscatus]|uniref:PQQ-binding-like beta-propeller repeat protein n=1 Tax=Streptomyces cyaneofuscatus TaxID=66883 RepID=UPI003321CF02